MRQLTLFTRDAIIDSRGAAEVSDNHRPLRTPAAGEEELAEASQ
jgi:hypothetical protein